MDFSRSSSESCIITPPLMKPELPTLHEPEAKYPTTKEKESRSLDSPKEENKKSSQILECTSKKEREEECTRERLKKHRQEMAGRVWIPDIWGQESLLKDVNVLDRSLVPKGLLSAREALVQECRRSARPLRVNKSC